MKNGSRALNVGALQMSNIYKAYNPFGIIEDFEEAICNYTGAPYAVTTNSCTNALFLSLEWYKRNHGPHKITIPRHTYVSVPMQIIWSGHAVAFDDCDWEGCYQLKPTPIWDCARRFTWNMYCDSRYHGAGFPFLCTSFHWTKPLGIQHGGAILHNNAKADTWLRRARFDGRLSGEPASSAKMIGWHCLTTPEVASAGVVRISNLPKDNPDAPKPDYPDLSQMEIFK
jgi:dTDP-4-amino-4,6-dideoxygalactose transaminase